MKVSKLKPNIGAKIEADMDALLSGRHAGEIREILEARGVLVFPEVNFTNEQQIAFTRTLGEIIDEGENNVYKVTMDTRENAHADYLKAAFYWHIDGTTSEVPILASLLSGRRLADKGGETEFCNTYAAYEDLPEEDKQAIDKLKVLHSLATSQFYVHPEPSYEQMKAWRQMPSRTIPLVWHHRTGRKSLVVGATASHVEGMDVEEGRELLVRLRDWATQPKYVYQHKWTLGDLVIWDNTGTMHRAMPYAADSGRMMHRTKLAGEEALG